MTDLLMESDATISPCGVYRYRLSRRWATGPTCVFVMLNPSTADASQDDPTIRRCIGFARREGCGALVVVNLMAYRATDPENLPDELLTRCGLENLDHISRAAREADGPIIAAWGAHKKAVEPAEHVLRKLAAMGEQVYTLKRTKAGAPGHPLYVKADAPLVPMFPADTMEGLK